MRLLRTRHAIGRCVMGARAQRGYVTGRAGLRWMRWVQLALFSGALSLAGPALSDERFAVIVSAETYTAPLAPARGAEADGDHIAAALKQAGFTVRRVPEATTGDIRRAAFWLGENLTAAGPDAFGVAYVAAHAANVSGRSYLLGVDARWNEGLTSATPLAATSGAPAALFTAAVDRSGARGLILLDASAQVRFSDAADRGDSHQAGSDQGFNRGLAALEPPERGVLVFDNPPGLAAPGRAPGPTPFAQHAAQLFASNATPRSALRTFRRHVRQDSLGWRTPWIAGRLPNALRLSPAPDANPQLRGSSEGAAGPLSTRTVVLATTRGTTPHKTPRPSDRPADVLAWDSLDDTDAGRLILTEALTDGIRLMEDAALSARVGGRDVLVFVPGFDHDPRSAALAAAQLAGRIGHEGPTAVYAWPSLGERSAVAHRRDAAAATAAADGLVHMVRALDGAGAREVNLISDGLGARTAVDALAILAVKAQDAAADTGLGDPQPPVFHAIIAAPDLDRSGRARRLRAALDGASALTLIIADADPDRRHITQWRANEAEALALALPPLIADARAAGVAIIRLPGDAQEPLLATDELARHLGTLLHGRAALDAPFLRPAAGVHGAPQP